jgi:hypothetical protein
LCNVWCMAVSHCLLLTVGYRHVRHCNVWLIDTGGGAAAGCVTKAV